MTLLALLTVMGIRIPPSIFHACSSCPGSQRLRSIAARIGARGRLHPGQVTSVSPGDIITQANSHLLLIGSFQTMEASGLWEETRALKRKHSMQTPRRKTVRRKQAKHRATSLHPISRGGT